MTNLDSYRRFFGKKSTESKSVRRTPDLDVKDDPADYPESFEYEINGNTVMYIGALKQWEDAALRGLPIRAIDKNDMPYEAQLPIRTNGKNDSPNGARIRYMIREENGDLVDIQQRGFDIKYVQTNPIIGTRYQGFFRRKKQVVLYEEYVPFVIKTDKK